MAVKVNKSLKTVGGASTAPGSIFVYSLLYHPIEYAITTQFIPYASLSVVKDKGSPLCALAGIPLRYTAYLSEEDYFALTDEAIQAGAKQALVSSGKVSLDDLEDISKDQLQPDERDDLEG